MVFSDDNDSDPRHSAMTAPIIPIKSVLSAEEIAAQGAPVPDTLRLPAADLFVARAARLKSLANGHAMAEFLNFCAGLIDAQQQALAALTPAARPDEARIALCRSHDMPLLDAQGGELDASPNGVFGQALATLLQAAQGFAPAPARDIIVRLQALPADQVAKEARLILKAESGFDTGYAPFLGAALQVDWTHRALALTKGDVFVCEEGSLCPVCGSHPVASVVRIGEGGHGVRYAVCGLCASEWHVTRIKCVPCMNTKGIAYSALEGEGAERFKAVQVETCDECKSALKLVSLEKDHNAEPFADDLATLMLDMLVDDAGYHRAGRNLFYFAP